MIGSEDEIVGTLARRVEPLRRLMPIRASFLRTWDQAHVSFRVSAALASLLLFGSPAVGQEKEARRLEACRTVLVETMDIPEGIPEDLLHKAHCVLVIPSVKKVALGIGGRYGKGAAVCRRPGGRLGWGPPLMVGIKGGSVGAQIGGQAADFVFLVMNAKGVQSLLKSKFTLGADASVAVGPKGRNLEADTDLHMRAEILTYSRSRGLFIGISLEGAVVKHDGKANRKIYGRQMEPKDLLLSASHPIPSAGRPLVDALGHLSPRKHSASSEEYYEIERPCPELRYVPLDHEG